MMNGVVESERKIQKIIATILMFHPHQSTINNEYILYMHCKCIEFCYY